MERVVYFLYSFLVIYFCDCVFPMWYCYQTSRDPLWMQINMYSSPIGAVVYGEEYKNMTKMSLHVFDFFHHKTEIE